MKQLSKSSIAIFEKIIAKMENNHAKINNAPGVFMPLVVEKINSDPDFMGNAVDVISLAHYYEQNGDLMVDPEMLFFYYKKEEHAVVIPALYQQDNLGIYQESIFRGSDEQWKIYTKLQHGHTTFANMWLRNIKEQQNL